MAHGKPLLTTDVVGQAPVICENEAGVIVSPGDVSGIIAGSIKLLTHRVYRESLAQNARRLAEKMFSARAVVDEIEALYRQLLARPRASTRWASKRGPAN
jgi:glycosyltransferase involved in cell wall biosynthesis